MLNFLKTMDRFILFLIATVILASVLPCRGQTAVVMGYVTDFAIALLFFLHGAKLSRQAVIAGIGHWRLHLVVLTATFILYPILGLGTRWVMGPFVDDIILAGVLYLCLLPSTVQSSIAFTAIAGGNVPAAICSATLSNLLGILITPLLVHMAMDTGGGGSGQGPGALDAIKGISVQLLLPFVLGHLCRPLLTGLLNRLKNVMFIVDRGSILLVVYTAFSAAVVGGIWGKLTGADLAWVVVLDAAILATLVATTVFGGKALGFSREDRISIVFCGSKKSLLTGVPMAGVLFPAPMVGALILPLMLYHQIELMLCAVLARRYGAETERIAAAVAKTETAAVD